jgi:integrase
MGLYKRGNVYWMSFTDNRRQYHRSTGTTDRKLAEKIHAKVLTQIAEGKWFEIDEAKHKTFEDLKEQYLSYSQTHKSAKGYKNDYTYMNHLQVMFGGLTLDRITPLLIAEYRDKRLQEGRAPQTVKHELNCLNRAFNLAMREWQWVRNNPCNAVQKPTIKNQILRWLSPEEEDRLLKAAEGYLNGQLVDIIITALHTGMRMGEILALKWKDVDFQNRTITVMQHKTRIPKTIPMSDVLYETLSRRHKTVSISGYVFTTNNQTPISQPNLQREFWKTLRKAGITNFRFHDLRHTFATRLVQAGVDIYAVAKLLGHTDIKTTQRYAHHSVESVRHAIEKLENFQGQKWLKKTV